jgi:hypothetical protein
LVLDFFSVFGVENPGRVLHEKCFCFVDALSGSTDLATTAAAAPT